MGAQFRCMPNLLDRDGGRKEVKMGAMTMTPSLGLVLVLDRPISRQMKYLH
jgi:hypothetical protein